MKYFLVVVLFFLSLSYPLKSQSVTIYSGQEPLDSAVNSASFEENPVLHPSGTQLFFTRIKHAGNVGGRNDRADIWVSESNGQGGWSVPVNAGAPVNTTGWDALIGFADSGNELYLSKEYKDNTNLVRKGVAVSRKNGNSWSEPVLLEIPFFNNRSDHQSGWITADGSVMILSLESPAGYGAEDLYVCFRQGPDQWTSPRNLGFQINTPFQEMTPFLAEDKKTLIFATNGIAGLGSRDLFISERQDDSWRNWSEPASLGSKVNTPGTELSFSFRPGDEYAYLVSTQNSEGYGDIKRVKITADIVAGQLDSIPQVIAAPVAAITPEETLTEIEETPAPDLTEVKGTVRDAKSLSAIAATISVTGGQNEKKELLSGQNGEFTIQLLKRQSYTIKVAAKGYLEEQLTIETFDEEERNQTVLLQPLSEGNTITLSHVLFEQGTPDMVKGSEAELDRVVNMMKENAEVQIYITGHTDNQGPAKANIELSEQRVESVIEYLTSKGVEPTRLSGKGFGPTRPIASNASEETRKLNRRVEFTIVKGN